MSERKSSQGKTGRRAGVVKPALVGAGIGSAAIVAALLYAGKLKQQKRRDDPPKR